MKVTCLLLAFLVGEALGAHVHNIDPNYISYGGGVIFVYGSGFAGDNFNFDDPILGNKIWFYNDFETLVCQTPVDKNWLLQNPQAPSTTKVVCSLPARQSSRGGNVYTMKMTVDGNEVESAGNHVVHYDNYRTPRLRSIDHRYGAPGDLVTVTGRIMSKNVGPGASDLDNFDEIDETSLQNFFLGTAPCDFMTELGEPYGVYRDLNNDGETFSFEGNFTCKTSGSFIGPQEGQLLVSTYGLSVTEKGAYSVNSKGQKFFYHTLPEVSSVSPNVGADVGGTYITIEGKGFDGYKDNTQVYVNDALCENVEVTDSLLTCRSPSQAGVGSSAGGPRGLKYNLWLDEVVDETAIGAGVDALDVAASEEFIVDQGFIDEQMSTEQSDYTGRLSGLFVAPESGNFTFGVCSNDAAELYLGTSEDPSTKVLVANSESACNKNIPSLGASNKIELVKGQNYWIEAVHVHRDSVASNKTNFLQISLRQFNTVLNNKDLDLAIDELQVIYVNSDRVLEKQKITLDGVAGSDITFTHNGQPASTPIVADAFDTYEENLKSMFQWQCSSSQTRFEIQNGFEDPDDKINGFNGAIRFWGYGDRLTEPFCGNGIAQNPWSIFAGDPWNWQHQPLDASSAARYLCFASKGYGFYNGINALFRITTKQWTNWDAWVNLNVSMQSDDWNYQCVDLLEHFKTDSPNWFINNWLEDSKVQLRRVHFPIDDVPTKKAFLDEVSFGNKENTIERTPPAFFSTHTRLENIIVNATSATEVEIEFDPYTCQSEEETFQLLGISGATIDEMTTEATGYDLVLEQIEYLKTNDIATFSVNGGKVIVERLSKESPANTGTFSIAVGDKVYDGVPPYIDSVDFQEILENELGLSGVVGRESTWNKCYDWDISWYYRETGGDQPQVTVDGSNIINNGKEGSLAVGAWTQHEGSVKIIQPGGDFFRLPADDSSADPEVTVWVSGFLCKCLSGASCSFSYDASLTPTITDVSSELVDGSIVLTISGTGFTDSVDDFSIDVGGRSCEVSAASSTTVTCTLENGPAGDLDISLWVKSKGKATGTVVYTLSLAIVDFSPKAGSVGGGTVLTIEGTGFPNSMEEWEGNTLTIGGNPCKITETSYTEVTCITPKVDAAKRRRKREITSSEAELSITVNGQTATGSSSYSYDASSTPTVTDLSTLVGSPQGGETLVITGTMFDYESPFNMVTIGEDGAVCDIVSWKPEEIECILPPLPNGEFNVYVKTKNNGVADASQVSAITVDFTVTGASPLVGSIQGGTKMNIAGSGFGNCSGVTFNVGPEHSCVPEEGGCTDTLVSCTVTKNPTMYTVRNSGRHSSFGPGYVWEPNTVTIRPGDKVRWSWNLPSPQEGNGIAVHSTYSATSKEYDGMGYNSGEKASKGNLIYQFMSEGTFYYNTQEVLADEGVYMPGKVVVAAPSGDEVVEITASVGSIVADTVLSGSPAEPEPADGCTFSDSSCATASASTSVLEFTFSTCVTPTVTSVMASSGSTVGNASSVMGYGNAELTISGTGFSSYQCENSVSVGGSNCEVTSSSENSIVCNIDAASITSMKAHTVTVNVANKGEAVQNVGQDSNGKLYVMPKVDTIAPLVGSWAGGSILKLSGNGLNPDDGIVTVNFGESPFQKGCAIVEVTSTMIACRVPDFRDQKAADEKVVQLDIYFSGQMLRGEIDDSLLNYTFSTASTPSSEAATPNTYSTATAISVAGSGFGSDASAVSVYLRSTALSASRKRRSAESILEEIRNSIDYGYGPKPKVVHTFWKRLKREIPSNSLTWNSPRSKRNTDRLPWLTPEDHMDEFEELYHPEVEHIHARTVRRAFDLEEIDQELYHSIMENEPTFFHRVKRAVAHGEVLQRRKRSTDAELLEMSMEGAVMATVTAVSDTSVTFTPPEMPAGDYNVIVYVSGSGNADASSTVLTSEAIAASVSPSCGSIYGGQSVTIYGNGFSGSCDDTTIVVGSGSCTCTDSTPASVTCTTSAGAEGDVDVIVTSNGVAFPAVTYTYSASCSPTVTSVTPDSGSGAQSLTIVGSNFGSSPSVNVGGAECSITASSSDSISCDLPAVPGGDYPVDVYAPEYGVSNSDILYAAELTASSIAPMTGSFGGGTLVTISGVGFDTMVYPTVTVCTDECIVESVTDTEVQCRTPANSGSGTVSCSVSVSQSSGKSVELTDQFTYDDSLTPQALSVSPKRGGTGGGTRITITGTGFADSGNKVFIDGVECDICSDCSESSTSITCLTNAHDGCIEVPVTVEVPGQGYAQTPDDGSADFYYIDRWNSIWTWGGTGTPLAGELIHITEGQNILLDTSTPVLKFLLIDGGKLMFDRDADGLNLQAEYILIINGGGLEIGTEEEPYLNQAGITMHGNVRCTELPIYGCKTIGVREGTLDLHGEFVPMTWTYLAETAEANATEIVLKNGVNWKPGSEIVVATTGDRASMGESEKKVIDSVSADGTVITLTEPLKFKHISISQTFGEHEVETRAEVGLLTRNIKIQGSVNQQFVTEIPACEKPFVANEEAQQSCFQGKFGEEIGTDEFGSIIFIHAKDINQHLAKARIEYTEFTEVGQAFRVGRYPIHFHINGNASSSYVRGNAIHRSYNRACTIHAVDNLLVEHNVAFNVKGLSFFIEDGVEENNIVQYNLAVFTRQSNSLLNPDIQPGSFWIVNANNIVQHNAVAGSTHFGYWFRVLKYPDGPSRTTSYCPAKAPIGRFYNNSAHSCGLYGIWIFTAGQPGWTPMDGTRENGWCDGKNYITATLGDFTAWNNEIGVEIVEGGAIRFENMTLLDNEKSGVELIHPIGAQRQNGEEYGAPTFKNGVVIGHSEVTAHWPNGDTWCTKTGVKGGWWGQDVENVEFYNFDRPTCAALGSCARCKPKWASGKTQTSGLSFTNSPNKVNWPWTMSGHYHDLDGTLCGTPDCKVVQKRDIYDPSKCVDDTDDEFSHIEGGPGGDWLLLGLRENDTVKLDGYVCDPEVKFHTVGFDKYAPSSLQFNDVVWHNEFGHAYTPWRKKPPHKDGWAAVLQEGPTNFFFWETMDHITNITYNMGIYQLADEGDYLLIGHNFTQSPDVFTFNGEPANETSSLSAPPTYDTAGNGEWYWSGNETKELTYIISHKNKGTRKKRGGKPNEMYRQIQFRVYRCLYEGCLPPPPPTVPAGRPLDFLSWSSEDDWISLGLTKPVAGASGIVEEWVTIPPGVWMVLDENPPPLTRMYIYGVLEIDDQMDMELSAEIIMIQGDTAQLVAGYIDEPYQNNFNLVLRGNHYTPDQPLPNGPNLGAKALGVFGKLQLHGLDVGTTWTRLAADAAAGDNTIVLQDEVDPAFWKEGAEIIIAPTGFEPTEAERMTIASIDGTTITLTESLSFEHLGSEYSLTDGSVSWKIAAEVGLLTRNIKIIGEDYEEMGEEEFGARVLVAKFTQEGTEYRGYAKFSNVEFVRAGQEGWTDYFDPRYSLAFVNHEDSIDGDESGKESYVKKCAFNFNYNAAIGLFNSNNIAVEDNVVFRTLEYGLRDESIGNRWIHNLIVLTRFVGIHKNQRQNVFKRGCFNFLESLDPEFRDNAAAGCERAGFTGTGHICSSEKRWSNNVIHTVQDGVFVNTYQPAITVREDKDCVVFRGFFIYKAYDYAFYLLTHDTVEMEDNLLVDNGVGIHPFLIRPKPTTHDMEYKHLRINNTVIVGRNDETQCDTGDNTPSYDWYDSTRNKGGTKWPGRNWKGYSTGHAGLLWPIFSGIGVPLGKPWVNGKPKSFPLLTGQVYLNNITFANFNKGQCDGQFDSAVRTNPRGDDMQFPIFAQNTRFVNVDDGSKVWMDRPIMKLVVNEHCVDMHCDGLKKALLVDMDGTFLNDGAGSGTIVADSAYEWEGNPSAGLGYYRIPKTMITEVNGDKIEYADKMPNLGIVHDGCTWHNDWHAYSCHGINHRLMIMESLDIDTLDRRLSPVAVLANPGPTGTIDLINGPQDWSCCFGYACQKRISNFYSIVGTNMMYEVHLTSTPPIQMRFRINNNEGGDAVLLKLFFPKPQRIDIYVGDQFIYPNNYDFANEDGGFKMLPADDSFIPSLDSLVEGENYFDPTTGFLYLLLRGTEPVDYRIQPSVVTKVGASIDMDNFFEGDVAGNIAALLGIDPANIRVTNIVREGKRKKRFAPTWDNSEDIVMEMTIEPPPVTNLTEGTTAGSGSAMSYGDLKQTMADLTSSFQNGSFAASLAESMNITVNTMATQEPLYVPQPEDFADQCIPQDDDPEGECYLGPEDNAVTGTPWSVASQANATQRLEASTTDNVLQMPTALVIGSQQPFTANEMSPMDPKPTLYMVDQFGDPVLTVGSEADPWIVTASLVTGSGALVGNVTCQFDGELCIFDDMGIDAMGEGYSLQFDLTYPGTETDILPAISDEFEVESRTLSVQFTELNKLNPVNQTFTAVVSIWDVALDMPAEASVVPADITCTLSVLGVDGAELLGTLSVAVTGSEATFSDLESSETISNGVLGADCVNPSSFAAVAFSDSFNVHPYPKTGTVRDASAAFTYEGGIYGVGSVLDAFADTLGVSMDVSSSAMMKNRVVVDEKAPVQRTFLQGDISSWPDFEELENDIAEYDYEE